MNTRGLLWPISSPLRGISGAFCEVQTFLWPGVGLTRTGWVAVCVGGRATPNALSQLMSNGARSQAPQTPHTDASVRRDNPSELKRTAGGVSSERTVSFNRLRREASKGLTVPLSTTWSGNQVHPVLHTHQGWWATCISGFEAASSTSWSPPHNLLTKASPMSDQVNAPALTMCRPPLLSLAIRTFLKTD